MADLALFKQLGKIVNFNENQTVFMQDDEGDSMYIVLKGTFGVYINSFSSFPIRVAEVRQGSFFGEMSVIDGWPRSATIIAEEDGAALAVDMSNFGLLLDKAPDIADSIFNTLRNRALTTAEAVTQSGKKAPEMPQMLKAAKYHDAKSRIAFLTMLAERVRSMNALLAAPEEPQTAPIAKPERVEDELKLLPDGYIPINERDENDNRLMLHVKKYICPYCKKETQAPIPVFSALKPQSSALDGRIIYKGFDILRYTNIICNNCNYTDNYQEFGKPRSQYTPTEFTGNQFKNTENFNGYIDAFSHTADEAIKSYYLNIACLTATTESPISFAKAWIRLYWLYNDHERGELKLQCAKRALHYYKRYLSGSGAALSVSDMLRLNATMGELCVALGDSETAKTHYGNITGTKSASDDDFIKKCKSRLNEIKKMR